MSSYLVAFVVGPLEATDPVDVNGTPLRVVYPKGKAGLTAFGLDCGRAALAWFEEYYGIPYPGDKVDLVGLPDFAAGAMENLGCITFAGACSSSIRPRAPRRNSNSSSTWSATSSPTCGSATSSP
ncbi:MAG: M1 family aminopeptidase [Ilumatobacteraceae bacterium]